MPPTPEFMRPIRTGEENAVDVLLRAAFAGHQEADLVRNLRAAGQMELEMVLPSDEGLAGYLALSRMVGPQGWLALAPVAIAPEWQGKRLGTRLVAGTLRLMAIKGLTTVVLGQPGFYGRTGFSLARAARLVSRYSAEYTLIARPGEDVPEETLTYPAAFDAV